MGSVCAEHHKFHLFSPRKKGGLDIPPRKLIGRRNAAAASSESTTATDTFLNSLNGLEKFLPSNGGGSGSDSDDSCSDDPYSSDHFRMYVFKVRRCTRSRSHEWTDCPFTHPGEKAQRRDPRRFHYSGTVCSEFRRGSCSRGDSCEFAHGVFESWLHPSRYRTEACKDGKNCKRKVCFFAHSPRELRILPLQADNSSSDPTDRGMYQSSAVSSASHQPSGRCCLFCHQPSMASSSPTSTLMALSHHSSPPISPSQSLSPPLSPMKHRAAIGGLSPSTRYAERLSDSLSYREALSEIMGSLDAMKVSDVPTGDFRNKRNVPWVDMSFPGDDQTLFILSPAALSPASMPRDSSPFADGGLGFFKDYKVNRNSGEDRLAAASDPDLGWVNELLI